MKFFSFFSKFLLASFFYLLAASTHSYAQITPADYVTTWKTDAGGSGSDQITIPAYGEYIVYYESIPAGISGTLPATGTFIDNQTITFPAAGTYRVAIKPTGAIPFHRINFIILKGTDKLLTIEQWGTTVWSSMENAYDNCSALTTLPETDLPVLSSVTTMAAAFHQCYSLTGSSNMNSWDLSNVTNIGTMFAGTTVFNQPIGDWDVSNVTITAEIFSNATSFNQPIGSWNVGHVRTMSNMFDGATSFNQPLGNWDVSSVVGMADMFRNATSFNQPVNNWDVSNVANMESMFENATAFNQPVNSWNVSNVSRMADMFGNATSFNKALSNWTFRANNRMTGLLAGSGMDCGNFNATLIGWAANPATPDGRSIGVTGLSYGPPASAAHDDLINNKGWNISDDTFDAGCTSLVSSANFVTVWKTDVPSPGGIGLTPSGNNQIRIAGTGSNYSIIWEQVGNPANKGTAFGSGVTTITFPVPGTYQVAISPGSGTFTRIDIIARNDAHKILEVRQWGDIQWESLQFSSCVNLKVTATDIPDLQNVTSMEDMFLLCSSLKNVPGINDWDVSSVTNMHQMFLFTPLFNEPIGNWDVSNVTDMSGMFNASGFNQPIGSWNVSNVTNMNSMFSSAPNFNQPLTNWDVSNVTSMYQMFYSATAFNQSLGNWTIPPGVGLGTMLSFSGMDCASMALTLEGWAANPATPNNIFFDADGVDYGLPAAAALETLRNTKGWTITIGDAVVCAPLEVSLISFTAKSIGGTVRLEWATASETDNNYFDVERSADARSWNPVGRIKGAGTVNTERNYSLIDTNPLEGNSYYRLKIVDMAGKADYSGIRAINIKTGSAVSSYPNPATTSLTISGKANGSVKIYNLSGQKVLQTEIKTEKTVIPLSGFPAGAYVIKSDDGWHSKFIKQ